MHSEEAIFYPPPDRKIISFKLFFLPTIRWLGSGQNDDADKQLASVIKACSGRQLNRQRHKDTVSPPPPQWRLWVCYKCVCSAVNAGWEGTSLSVCAAASVCSSAWEVGKVGKANWPAIVLKEIASHAWLWDDYLGWWDIGGWGGERTRVHSHTHEQTHKNEDGVRDKLGTMHDRRVCDVNNMWKPSK